MTSFEHAGIPRQPEDDGFEETLRERQFAQNAFKKLVQKEQPASQASETTDEIVIPAELEGKGILNEDQSAAVRRAFDEGLGGRDA